METILSIHPSSTAVVWQFQLGAPDFPLQHSQLPPGGSRGVPKLAWPSQPQQRHHNECESLAGARLFPSQFGDVVPPSGLWSAPGSLPSGTARIFLGLGGICIDAWPCSLGHDPHFMPIGESRTKDSYVDWSWPPEFNKISCVHLQHTICENNHPYYEKLDSSSLPIQICC